MVHVDVKKLHPDAKIPTKATAGSACFDLYSVESNPIPEKGFAVFSTGIAVKIPPDHMGVIRGRSGLSFKYDIECRTGIIDSDYRGEIKVKLYNFSDKPYYVRKHDRIAQLSIEVCPSVVFLETDFLDDTTRSVNGFGSTGK